MAQNRDSNAASIAEGSISTYLTGHSLSNHTLMKSLSIITVTWNCKRYLEEFLDSLQPLRENPEIEVIVVDNASDDGTTDLVRDRYPDVLLVQSGENLGFSKGNNLGVAKSTGRYLCLINPDVRVLDSCIEKLLAYMKRNPGIGLLGPKMLDADGRPSRSYMGAPTLWRVLCRALALDVVFPNKLFAGFLMPYFDQNHVADVDILNGWFWMTKRGAIDEVGLLDETLFMYGEDLDWSKRFLAAGWRVVYFPEAESIHYGAGASGNAPVRFFVEMQRANFQYWKKNYGPISQVMYLAVISLHQVVRIAGQLLTLPFQPARKEGNWLKITRSLACLRWAFGSVRARTRRSAIPSEGI